MTTQLSTEITRNITDSCFSMDELFYRYFNTMPLLFLQTGSTDLYDRPSVSHEDNETSIENPIKGPGELEVAVEKLFEFLRSKKINEGDRSQVEIAEYCNFPGNKFAAFLIFKTRQIIAQINIAPGKRETLTSISLMGQHRSQPLWPILVDYCKGYIQPELIRQDQINLITMSDNDFYLKSIPLITKGKQEFSYDFYNDDFKPICEQVIASLQSPNQSGLVLFHGDVGTGKTSVCKHLLHIIQNKKIIYLPPNLITYIADPNFISFMLSRAMNSILLVEDAENILKPREAGENNQSVSNILNISDGILGDLLKIQIICTFNSPIDQIDKALLRPGRLLGSYRFKKLDVNKTNNLLHKLYGNNIETVHEEMSLAEVFNFKDLPARNDDEKKSAFGFI